MDSFSGANIRWKVRWKELRNKLLTDGNVKHGTVLEESNWVNSKDNTPRYWHIYCMKPNPDGKTFAVGTGQGEVSIYSTSDGLDGKTFSGLTVETKKKDRIASTAKKKTQKPDFEVTALDYSPSGKYLTALSTKNKYQIISVYDVSDLSNGLEPIGQYELVNKRFRISFISEKLIVGFTSDEFFFLKLTEEKIYYFNKIKDFKSDIKDLKRHRNTIIFLLENGDIHQLVGDKMSIIVNGENTKSEESSWGFQYYAKHDNIVLASKYKLLYMCDLSKTKKTWKLLDKTINKTVASRIEFSPDGKYIIAYNSRKLLMYPFINNNTVGKKELIASDIDFIAATCTRIPANEAVLSIKSLNKVVIKKLRFK